MRIPLPIWVLVGGGALLLEACAKLREREEGDAPDHIYRSLKPTLDKNCVPCHQGEEAAGNYDLSTYVKKTPDGYVGIVGYGSGLLPNAIAGNPYSRILTILGERDHSAYLSHGERETVIHWVVNDRLARFWISGMHPPGWLNPVDPDFHGEDLAQNNWNLAECRSCHGEEGEVGGAYGGGGVAIGFGDTVQSCVQCHGESPESCTTCHGNVRNAAPPRSLRREDSLGPGAHQSHLRATIGQSVSCPTCHIVPERFDDPRHIDPDGPAEVTFGGLAIHNGAEPRWAREAATCSASYCHRGASPIWTLLDGSQKACTSCHDDPHYEEPRCVVCHEKVAGPDQTIRRPRLHVSGSVEVGVDGVSPDSLDCNSCHALDGSVQPPRALTWEGSLGVAAHPSHIVGHGLTQPIGCDECHGEPDSIFSVGHIDSPLPAEVDFGPDSRARAGGFSPVWDRMEASCSSVYCHLGAKPVWPVVDGSQRTCTSCHAEHSHGETRCSVCHGKVVETSMSDSGETTETIRDPSLHVTGTVEVGPEGVSPAALTCRSCHDLENDPPMPLEWEGSFGGEGARSHRIHSETRITQRIGCAECHREPAEIHSEGHFDPLPAEVDPSPNSRARFRGIIPAWDRSSPTCTNGCHLRPSPDWNDPDAVVGCNSCHGDGENPAPPPPHPPVAGINSCVACHPNVVNARGEIIDPERHINGQTDF